MLNSPVFAYDTMVGMRINRGHSLSRRTFLRGVGLGLSAILLSIVRGRNEYQSGTEPWFEWSEWDVAVPGLAQEFDNFTCIHLTDIHSSSVMNLNRLLMLQEAIFQKTYDCILVTGDCTYHSSNIAELVQFFGPLAARTPVFMVMGNHDYWDGGLPVLQPVFQTGVTLLQNGYFPFERAQNLFLVAGLDNVWEEKDDLEALLLRLPGEHPAILLVHEPDVADRISKTNRFFLQLSGHSHGGQICFANGYAPVLPWLGQKYFRGLYQVGSMMVYTSRGLGMSRPFVRMNCPAEAVIYHFHPGSQAKFTPVNREKS